MSHYERYGSPPPLLAREAGDRRTAFLPLLPDGVSADDALAILYPSLSLDEAWSTISDLSAAEFEGIVSDLVDGCAVCSCCDAFRWSHDLTSAEGYGLVCESCQEDFYRCERCEELVHSDDATAVGDDIACGPCESSYAFYCGTCEVSYWTTGYEDHTHADECECEAPHQRFTFPNGSETVSQDERLTVELPAGTISEEGVRAIRRKVLGSFSQDLGMMDRFWAAAKAIDTLDPTWQTKRGNYTRRLSSELHKVGYKLSPALISEVGNLARQHTSSDSPFDVEFTRDLNLSAADFYHEDSCWWQSYTSSRCALKSWGGIGLRTFDDHGDVSGRAWVQPLDQDLRPTPDAINAHAFVVYNGYGDLSGYAAARIIAQLTGRTYRKVSLSLSPQFVNADSGCLVADPETTAACESVHFSADEHDVLHPVSPQLTLPIGA